MRLQDILEFKGRQVHCIAPTATLGQVVEQLVRFNCGSLVVCEGDQMVGIITERDILRSSANYRDRMRAKYVVDCMTSDPIVGHPDDEVEQVMGLLTERRIRHLPVVEGERLVGIVSIGDLVKGQYDVLCRENYFLKSYIHG